MQGGGGTDMRVGIKGAIEQGYPIPNIIIVMTDGYTPWPKRPVRGVKVVACIIDSNSPSVVDAVPSWIKTVEVKD